MSDEVQQVSGDYMLGVDNDISILSYGEVIYVSAAGEESSLVMDATDSVNYFCGSTAFSMQASEEIMGKIGMVSGEDGTIDTVSAASVLAGDLTREQVEGRVVVIGATVIGSGDVFHTPFDPVLPGVEVISMAISHLVAGDGLLRDRRIRLADAALAVLLPMVVVALLGWRRSLPGLGAIAAVAALWLVANVLLFGQGIWMSAALPLAARHAVVPADKRPWAADAPAGRPCEPRTDAHRRGCRPRAASLRAGAAQPPRRGRRHPGRTK